MCCRSPSHKTRGKLCNNSHNKYSFHLKWNLDQFFKKVFFSIILKKSHFIPANVFFNWKNQSFQNSMTWLWLVNVTKSRCNQIQLASIWNWTNIYCLIFILWNLLKIVHLTVGHFAPHWDLCVVMNAKLDPNPYFFFSVQIEDPVSKWLRLKWSLSNIRTVICQTDWIQIHILYNRNYC